jgi:hypothetical protein
VVYSEDEIDGEPGVRIDAGVEMVRVFLIVSCLELYPLPLLKCFVVIGCDLLSMTLFEMPTSFCVRFLWSMWCRVYIYVFRL